LHLFVKNDLVGDVFSRIFSAICLDIVVNYTAMMVFNFCSKTCKTLLWHGILQWLLLKFI